MKRLGVLLVLAGALFLSPFSACAASTTQDFVTAQDWTEHMSQREKFMALIPPALLFSEYDVHLKLSLPQYMTLMDKVVLRNPQLQNEDVSSIFASTIYLFEPENRPALREMETNFLKGDYAPTALLAPRLTIKDILSETPVTEEN